MYIYVIKKFFILYDFLWQQILKRALSYFTFHKNMYILCLEKNLAGMLLIFIYYVWIVFYINVYLTCS